MVKIKGNEIREPNFTNSFGRRALLVQNHIMGTLKKLGIDRDYVEMEMEKIPQKKAPASVSFYYEGRNLKYSYSLQPRFVDNLYIIEKVLEAEVAKLLDGEITKDQFQREFQEDDDRSRRPTIRSKKNIRSSRRRKRLRHNRKKLQTTSKEIPPRYV